MIKFTKMQGIGNDYVYIDAINQKITNEIELTKTLSDRHFGIGSDGLILICKSNKADFKMRIINPDGSEAEMCGNGIRCVGKFVYDKKLTSKKEIDIETLAGIKHLNLIVKDDEVEKVKVDMGIPSFNPEDIPVKFYDKELIHQDIKYVQTDAIINDKKEMLTCVSVGNPHAICFTNDIDNFDVEKYGKQIENDKRFPNRTNVEFVEIMNRNTIKMRVWERGAGETLACGTGSCASTCAAILNGLTERTVEVLLLGGKLNIEWNKEDNHLYMTGPAVTVFEGIIKKY